MKYSTIALNLVFGTVSVTLASKHVRVHPKNNNSAKHDSTLHEKEGERHLKSGKSTKSKTSKSKASKSESSTCSYTDAAKSFDGDLMSIDWNELRANLFPSTEIQHVTTQDFLDSCTDELSIPYAYRTNWHLQVSDPAVVNPNSNQTSPLCMASLFCAFKGCNPNPNQGQENLTSSATIAVNHCANLQGIFTGGDTSKVIWDTLPADSEAYDWVKIPNNPSSNLPMKAIFPKNAEDVVAAVNFARENGIKISIKNSGHDYAGRSTKKGTLLLNMKKYNKYSSSIVSCLEGESFGKGDPCRLAKDRGKPGYVRVGGGENFAEMYLNVRSYNEAFGYQFTAFGGASATVSPFGYSMWAGLSGTTGGRARGFGADQILKIEMVLASGDHVRFGPTDWDAPVSPQIYPQTKEVSGECLNDDEWGECDCDIPFELLWRSVRGGGPGYGVILSLFLQLHKYEQYEVAGIAGCDFGLPDSPRNIKSMSVRSNFYIAYYMQDEDFFDGENAKHNGTDGFKAYGEVSYEKRSACSTPATTLGSFFCDGEGTSTQVVETYQTFVKNWNIASAPGLSSPLSITLTDDDVQAFQECTKFGAEYKAWVDINQNAGGGGKPNRFDPEVKAKNYTYNPVMPDPNPNLNMYCNQNPGECLAAEADGPDMAPPTVGTAPVLIPNDLAQEAFNNYSISVNYAAFGPGTMHGSDGMDSVTSAFRNAGQWTSLFLGKNPTFGPLYDDTFFAGAFQEFFQPNGTVRDEFGDIVLPPYANPLHASPMMYGPMKNDTEKACPEDMTTLERDEKCFPLIEAVFGSKQLKVLMAAKGKIDPSNIFTCDFCVAAPEIIHP
mmetsp:Transcript_18103/g.43533  ORF Transcript_18103/g.43533 Transcript_18103/m.43533 type:complete len:834 (+) Transcript_18103:86-2587(+)